MGDKKERDYGFYGKGLDGYVHYMQGMREAEEHRRNYCYRHVRPDPPVRPWPSGIPHIEERINKLVWWGLGLLIAAMVLTASGIRSDLVEYIAGGLGGIALAIYMLLYGLNHPVFIRIEEPDPESDSDEKKE